jgi:hypothetical protein
VKYAPDGTALWARRAGGDAYEAVHSVATDHGGNVYVAGVFWGVGIWDGGNNPDVTLSVSPVWNDAFLAKYDPKGDLQWVRQIGGSHEQNGEAVAVDGSGHVYLGGTFREVATFGADTTLTNAGGNDTFLARYDADGTLLWARQAGGPGDFDKAGIFGVTADPEGNAYATGYFVRRAIFGSLPPLQSAGGIAADLFAVKYDSDGAPQWAQRIGGGSLDAGQGVAVTPDGTALYVTGYFTGVVRVNQDTLVSAGGEDVLIARLEPASGALVWGARGGSSAFYERGEDLVVAKANVGALAYDVYVTGDVSGNGTFSRGLPSVAYVSHGFDDAFVISFRERPGTPGTFRSATVWMLGGSSGDEGYGVGTTDVGAPGGGVAVTGRFQGEARFGPEVLTSEGQSDIFVARLYARPPSLQHEGEDPEAAEPIPLAEVEAIEPARSALTAASPNPFRDATAFTLTLPVSQPVRAEVLDLLGRRVALLHDGVLPAGTHALTWTAGTAPPGVYFLRVTAGDETWTRTVTRVR